MIPVNVREVLGQIESLTLSMIANARNEREREELINHFAETYHRLIMYSCRAELAAPEEQILAELKEGFRNRVNEMVPRVHSHVKASVAQNN